MSDLIKQARADLDRVSPEAWVEVYGARLLDELERTTPHAQQAAASAAVLHYGHRAANAISEALNGFRNLTGWTPEGKRPKGTKERWAAAMVMALAVKTALDGFLAGCRPFLRQMVGEATPKGVEAAGRLEELMDTVRAVDPGTPATAAAVDRFEESIWKLRNQLLFKTGHPVMSDAAVRAAGGVQALAAERGQCETIGPGGRCWLYKDHPGDCRFKRKRGH